MRKAHRPFALAIAIAGVLGMALVATVAGASGGGSKREILTGYEETPALSTPGVGEFRAWLSNAEIRYELSFSGTESNVTQAHIHFENATNAGPIVVFLCTNLSNGPAGTQTCPATGGTVTGTIRAADIGAGAAAQGLGAGEFDEFVRALRAGATYVNVHSVDRPAGEIRAQIDGDSGKHGRH
jgi:CHRD domain